MFKFGSCKLLGKYIIINMYQIQTNEFAETLELID